MLLSLCPLIPVIPAAADDTATSDTPLLQVTVTLSPRADITEIPSEGAALYITARPNSVDNVPRAILDGSRGKPPPVLIARIPNVSSFPFEATLTAKDVTVEGAAADDASYWWQGQGLVVSARLDSDGLASTRDPTDLVGRNLLLGGDKVTVELQGRGVAGKFFTKKS